MARRLEPATYLQLYNDIQQEQDPIVLERLHEYVCALGKAKRVSCRQSFVLKHAIRWRQRQCRG